MSITYSADVFCDECGNWQTGICSGTPASKSAARAVAALNHNWVHHKGKDYCPHCWAKKEKHNEQ